VDAIGLIDMFITDTDKKPDNIELEKIVVIKDPDRFYITMDCSGHCNCGGTTHCRC